MTDQSLRTMFLPLVEYHEAEGLVVDIVTIEDILAETPPLEDDAATLRSYIAMRHTQSGARFVLLGGDETVLPLRTFHWSLFEEDYPTDLYFACHDGDWNADGDEFYGEAEDEPDLVPEVAIGRAPVSNYAEAWWFATRTAEFAGNAHAYRNQALLLGAVIVPYPWQPGDPVQYDGATVTEEIVPFLAELPVPMTATRLYQNHTAYEGALPLTREAVLAALDGGEYGLVAAVAHGDAHAIDVGDGLIHDGHMSVLSNWPDLAVAVLLAGEQASFVQEGCLLERALLAEDGGFVAGIGSAAPMFITVSDQLNRQLFATFAATAEPRLGEAVRLTMTELAPGITPAALRSYLGVMVLGDPALPLWTEGVVAVDDPPGSGTPPAATTLSVEPCYPNPFNPRTTISYTLPRAATVTVTIYDLAGKRVRTVASGLAHEAGRHRVVWDGTDGGGRAAPAGTYVFRVAADGQIRTGTMSLVK